MNRIDLQSGDRILLIQIRAMGDCILTTPLIRDLKLALPDCEIDLLAEPLPARILSNNPFLSGIIESPPPNSPRKEFIKLYKQLKRNKYRLSIDLLSTPGSALISRFAGAQLRIGYKLRFRSWAYSHPVTRSAEVKYNPLSKYDLTSSLNLTCNNPETEIHIDTKSRDAADKFLHAQKLDSDKLLIAFAPWSKREWRRWEIDNWLSFINEVSKQFEATWLLFGTDAERNEMRKLENVSSSRVVFAGMADIMETAALIQKCAYFVGCDNGLKHIAVALSIPTLTLYIGSDPAVWNPPTDPKHVAVDVRSILDAQKQLDKLTTMFETIAF